MKESSDAGNADRGGAPEPVWRRAWRYAVTAGVPARSLRIALVVGTILNLINQGDALAGGAPVNWIKLAMTYMVPYLVSTYGVVAFRLNAHVTGGDRGT